MYQSVPDEGVEVKCKRKHVSGPPLLRSVFPRASVARRHKFEEARPRRSFMLNSTFIAHLSNHAVGSPGTSIDIALVLRG
jgi:hypothetical protein